MSVIEAPTVHDWPVLAQGLQSFGHFVLLRIDALASVAVLDDDEVSGAAAHLPQDWFLGIALKAASLGQVNDKGRPLLDLDIYMVGLGPSEPVSVAIPISPAPQIRDDHPPIQVPFDLPWPNLYAHSYLNIVTVISRIYAGPDYFPDPLTDEQQRILLQVASKDQYHRYDAAFEELLKKAAQEQPAASAIEGSGTGSGSDSGNGSYDDFMLSDEAQLITAKYQSCHLYVELWLDPASCPGQPAPPSAFLEVAERLRGMMKEWYDKKLGEAKSRRPQLIKEWTQRVGEAAAGLEEEFVYARDATLNDDDISPEDAVDYRPQHDGEPEHPPRNLPEFSSSIPPAGFEPPQIAPADEDEARPSAPKNAPCSPTSAPEGISSVSKLQDRQDGAGSTSPPAAATKQVPPNRILLKGTSIVRDRLVSMKHAAVKSLHSVFARVRAKAGRSP